MQTYIADLDLFYNELLINSVHFYVTSSWDFKFLPF